MRYLFIVILIITAVISTSCAKEQSGPDKAPTKPASKEAPSPAGKDVIIINIILKDGAPVGGLQRLNVPQDTNLLLIVHADSKGTMHLHGYDKQVDFDPGIPAQLEVVTEKVGKFEIELHDKKRVIATLQVAPS